MEKMFWKCVFNSTKFYSKILKLAYVFVSVKISLSVGQHFTIKTDFISTKMLVGFINILYLL